ncbi:hypothetical protein B0H17DRAFT_37165 [Mycena rosella]|uniref:Secreted protein n=1 Tax=Mycena rosella TaxID=1033263 RepID=A0AAD7D7M3_MYCRO|nr:hypothetical protein B0H17DRAFT_37165 [Mycena rosella]
MAVYLHAVFLSCLYLCRGIGFGISTQSKSLCGPVSADQRVKHRKWTHLVESTGSFEDVSSSLAANIRVAHANPASKEKCSLSYRGIAVRRKSRDRTCKRASQQQGKGRVTIEEKRVFSSCYLTTLGDDAQCGKVSVQRNI